MPIYEYLCQSCGQHKEVLQSISDAPLTDCDACGQNTLKKMISSTSFRLTGGGWYETDFKGRQKPAEEKSTSGSETKASSSTDTSTSSSDGD